MRILLAHNYYQERGGEDAVVANERALLIDHGHEVKVLAAHNDEIRGAWKKVQTARRTSYSFEGRQRMAEAIANFRPDVVHVHNFFPLLTPAVYDSCAEASVPVVQTLHNFRTICAGGLLMRRGKPCEDCVLGSPYQAVIHRCYRESRLGSLPVARMIQIHRTRNTWSDRVTWFIALTEFAKSCFVRAGFPSDRISVKPNSAIDMNNWKRTSEERAGALFVGRLSPEKGIHTLLRAWRSLDVPLLIAGDGPLRADVQDAGGTVRWLGRLPSEKVREAMKCAAFLVMPTECYENFPVVLAEAFACRLPVIASRLGAMAEIVEDGVNGLHFAPGDPGDLVAKVRWAVAHSEKMGEMEHRARLAYEMKYTQQQNYRQLMAIYARAIQESASSREVLC